MIRAHLIASCVLAAWAADHAAALGEEPASPPPLHIAINEHFQTHSLGGAERCSDAEFARRSALDLTGIPPTVTALREFLADSSDDKRRRWVDELLETPHYVRHFATTLDIMLMERRAATHVSQDAWMAWLVAGVRENKSWRQLAREILAADGEDPTLRPAVRFYLDRLAEPNLITRDTARIFFGRDLQCAQCHDHPTVTDFLQSDYHGLLAFFAPGYPVEITQGEAKVTVYAEKAGVDANFESVFIKGVPHRGGARVPGGLLLDEPFYPPGDEYEVGVAAGVKSKPKFSRRAQLAEQATSGENTLFNQNIVNRLWAVMFGRGLVQPVDMHHPDNPPLNADLLHLLSTRFVAMDYDMRAFLRELALTDAYQAPFESPFELDLVVMQARAELDALAPRRSEAQALAKAAEQQFAAAQESWQAAEQALLPAATALDTARAAFADARQKLQTAETALAAAQTQLDSKQDILPSVQQAATAAAEAIAKLPSDQELAAAAAKFTERVTQLTTEIATLQKTVDETSPTIPDLKTTFATTETALTAARTAVEPLRIAWRSAEVEFQAARSRMEDAAARREAANAEFVAATRVAEANELREAVNAAEGAIELAVAAPANLQKQLDEYAATIAEAMQGRAKADELLAGKTAVLAAAQGVLQEKQDLAQAVRFAYQASEAARLKLPDDAVLIETTQRLKERADALAVQMLEPQQQVEQSQVEVDAAKATLEQAAAQLAQAEQEQARRSAAVREAEQEVIRTRERAEAARDALEARRVAILDRWSEEFRLAALKPLTPEQLCWSIFQVTGILDRHRAEAVGELDQAAPLTPEQLADPAILTAREVELEQRVYDKLKGHRTKFAGYYGAAAGEPQGDFFATVDQALYASNGGDLIAWASPGGDNVAVRMLQHMASAEVADELYLTVLTRPATPEEVQQVDDYLLPRSADREAAVKELVWSLLTSAEFRFNH